MIPPQSDELSTVAMAAPHLAIPLELETSYSTI